MMTYSPYDNLRLHGTPTARPRPQPPPACAPGGLGWAQQHPCRYPAMLVTASLHDHRVRLQLAARTPAWWPWWQCTRLGIRPACVTHTRAPKKNALALVTPPPHPPTLVSPQHQACLRCTHRDTQVCFWEPAKYVAALRESRHRARSDRQAEGVTPPALVLVTDMDAGHFACSGAGGRLWERARKLAFLSRALGQA